jgi:hypothetical protein
MRTRPQRHEFHQFRTVARNLPADAEPEWVERCNYAAASAQRHNLDALTGARTVAFVPGTGFAASVNPLPIVNLT